MGTRNWGSIVREVDPDYNRVANGPQLEYQFSNGRVFTGRPTDGNYAVRGWNRIYDLWNAWTVPWGS